MFQLHMKIAVSQRLVPQQVNAPSMPRHAPFLQDDVLIGNLRQLLHVLVDDEDGLAICAQLPETPPDLLPYQRGESFGCLVQHQQLGISHECTADCEHLLLPSGEVSPENLPSI